MLSINRVDGAIGIRTTNAVQQISQPQAELVVDTENSKIEMQSEPVKVLIDQRQCFNESGLMDNTTLSEDIAQRGRQAVVEGIGRRISEGDYVADPRSGARAMADMAFSNSFEHKEFGMVTMPRSRPRIEVVGGTLDIRVEEGKVSIDSRINAPIIDVKLGDVDIFLRQEPSIEIKYIDNKIDTKV